MCYAYQEDTQLMDIVNAASAERRQREEQQRQQKEKQRKDMLLKQEENQAKLESEKASRREKRKCTWNRFVDMVSVSGACLLVGIILLVTVFAGNMSAEIGVLLAIPFFVTAGIRVDRYIRG